MFMIRRRLVHLGAVAAVIAVAATCGREAPSGGVDLTGAGGTFPYPLYRRWFADYAERTGVRINYLSVGSDEGIRLLDSAKVDFGAIDRALTNSDQRANGCARLAVPTVAGAIAIVYNLPGVRSALRLDADVLAEIFAGRVTRWDAPSIAARNPGVSLPALAITVVHRGGGSGTSRAFAAFLASSAQWPRAVKSGGDVVWPIGVAVEGNEGIGAQVQQTVGALGYAELAYATLYHLQVALVRNALGEDVLPSDASVRGALAAAFAGGDHGPSLILTSAPRSYPIAALTWLVFDPQTLDVARREKVVGFIRWALHDGAAAAGRLEYVPLPPAVVAQYDSALTSLTPGPCPSGAPRTTR